MALDFVSQNFLPFFYDSKLSLLISNFAGIKSRASYNSTSFAICNFSTQNSLKSMRGRLELPWDLLQPSPLSSSVPYAASGNVLPCGSHARPAVNVLPSVVTTVAVVHPMKTLLMLTLLIKRPQTTWPLYKLRPLILALL